MLSVAITGNAGSGKSTVADFFSTLNIDVIYADKINSRLLSGSSFIPKWLGLCLHVNLVSEQGDINKKLLRSMLVDTPSQKKNIEALLHPVIMENIALQSSLLDENAYFVIEIPLLFETGMERIVDHIILMTATRKTLLSRLAARQDMDMDESKSLLDNQVSSTTACYKSNDIILNDGDNGIKKPELSSLHEKITLIATSNNE